MTARARGSQASTTQVPTDVLWQRELPAGRDRTTRLTADEIAAAAFGIAENENLPAASVKRIANRLGIPAPRLEQYLPDRDAALDLMLEHALGEVELPDDASQGDATARDWRREVERIATNTYSVVQRHPWLVELIGGRPATGPNGLRYVECALSAMRASGLDISAAALSFNAVLAFVAGSVRTQTSRNSAAQRADAEYLAAVVADGSYPQLGELFATTESVTADESFAQGLGYLLDGVAARVQQMVPGSTGSGP